MKLSKEEKEYFAPFEGLQRISAAMGYAYHHLDMKQMIKFRQSIDIFLDKILEMMDPKTIDIMVAKIYREKIRKAIIESND